MNFFINAARQNKDFSRLEKYLDGNNPLPALVTGVSAIHKAHFIAGLLGCENAKKTLVVMKNESDAVKLCADINMLLGKNSALLCPEKEMILADTEASSKEYEHKRINALSALIEGKCKAIVCSAAAAIQLTIPPEELKNIFQRFYRMDRARERDGSFGLGLSIAETIITKHRGRIWAESQNGVNSFLVELGKCGRKTN